MSDEHPIILYDGYCALCDASVQFVLKHEKEEYFYFAPLQSKLGQQLLKKYGIDTSRTDSIILIEHNQAYEQSTAALKVAGKLRFPTSSLKHFIFIPKPIRDFFYRLISTNRYKFFPKKSECILPEQKHRSRFLGEFK